MDGDVAVGEDKEEGVSSVPHLRSWGDLTKGWCRGVGNGN